MFWILVWVVVREERSKRRDGSRFVVVQWQIPQIFRGHAELHMMEVSPRKKARYRWDILPDLAVEKIYVYLPKRSRYNAAVTCSSWLRVLCYPEVWKTYTVRELTLTRSKFDYYKGYQDALDPFVAQKCLKRVARHFRRLTILPVSNFHNLFEFLSILNSYATYYDDYQMKHLRAFEFAFACQIRSREGIRIFGTGGKLLSTLTTLMGHLQRLQELKLENLLLERFEADHLLDSVLSNCEESLRELSVINCTKHNYFFMHCGLFLNLQILTISTNHIHPDLIKLISVVEALEELHVVQTEFTSGAQHVRYKDWAPLRENRSRLKLFLEVRGRTKEDIIWQERAPVYAIIHGTPYSKLTHHGALEILNQYGSGLRMYCQFGIPRTPYHRGRPMYERCDSQLLLLVRTCENLRTVAIHELISTSTLLLMAWFTKGQMQNLHVRRNAVIRRLDWQKAADWTDEFFEWLKKASGNYDTFHDEMSVLLGKKWKTLTDLEFKKLDVKTVDKLW